MTTPEQRQRITEIINAGLVKGLGEAKAGHLCVEAAICLALGEPHSDHPSCVAGPDRDFAVRINDANWTSPEVRAKALLPLALAQLGTSGADRTEWVRRVVEGTIRRIVPIALRTAAQVHPDMQHRASLEAAAMRCEQDGSRDAAAYAAIVAAHAARAARAAIVAAGAARAARAAADVADAADEDAARAAAYAAADVAAYAADDEYNADAYATRDDVLQIAVQVALDAYAAEEKTRMTTQHTPGPWHVDDDGTILAENNNEVFASHSDGSWHYIAATQEDRRLIAAAPDLLAACTHALDVLERVAHSVERADLPRIVDAAKAARDAIAKAKKDT